MVSINFRMGIFIQNDDAIYTPNKMDKWPYRAIITNPIINNKLKNTGKLIENNWLFKMKLLSLVL